MADNEPADDLRSVLAASIESSAASADTAPAAKVETEAKPEADTSAKGDDRPRDASGKFLNKDEADDKATKIETDEKSDADDKKPDAKADAKTEAKPETDDKKTDKTETKSDGREAPARWSASDKAMFKLQSPEAQEFLLRRHASMEAEFTKRNQEIVDLKKEYEPVQKLFAPHLDVMKQKGLTPSTIIQRWADVETKLASGNGIPIIAGIVQGYNIDKAALAKALGFTSGQAAQASIDAAAAPEDQTAKLLESLEQKIAQSFAPKLAKIDQWEASQQQARTNAHQARIDEINTKIDNFKSATNEKGELLHPYYDELEHEMTVRANSLAAMKQPIPDLETLYEQAVWANPSTRSALLATQKAAQEAKRAEEARAKATSARKAASSVTGAPGSGQPARPVRSELSLRESIEEAAADHAA